MPDRERCARCGEPESEHWHPRDNDGFRLNAPPVCPTAMFSPVPAEKDAGAGEDEPSLTVDTLRSLARDAANLARAELATEHQRGRFEGKAEAYRAAAALVYNDERRTPQPSGGTPDGQLGEGVRTSRQGVNAAPSGEDEKVEALNVHDAAGKIIAHVRRYGEACEKHGRMSEGQEADRAFGAFTAELVAQLTDLARLRPSPPAGTEGYVRFRNDLRNALHPWWRSNPLAGDDEIVDAVRRAVREATPTPPEGHDG